MERGLTGAPYSRMNSLCPRLLMTRSTPLLHPAQNDALLTRGRDAPPLGYASEQDVAFTRLVDACFEFTSELTLLSAVAPSLSTVRLTAIW